MGRDANESEDAACVVRVRRGDEAAFGELAERYAARICSHLYRMVGNREEAEDLTQECFIRAMRYLPSYDEQRPFRSWLYTIATNLGADAGRRRKRSSSVFEETQRAGVAQSVGFVEALDRTERLNNAVRQLAPRDAALVQMHYYEGMSIEDAAEVLGIAPGAAKTALCRARKRLRVILLEDA